MQDSGEQWGAWGLLEPGRNLWFVPQTMPRRAKQGILPWHSLSDRTVECFVVLVDVAVEPQKRFYEGPDDHEDEAAEVSRRLLIRNIDFGAAGCLPDAGVTSQMVAKSSGMETKNPALVVWTGVVPGGAFRA